MAMSATITVYSLMQLTNWQDSLQSPECNCSVYGEDTHPIQPITPKRERGKHGVTHTVTTATQGPISPGTAQSTRYPRTQPVCPQQTQSCYPQNSSHADKSANTSLLIAIHCPHFLTWPRPKILSFYKLLCFKLATCDYYGGKKKQL